MSERPDWTRMRREAPGWLKRDKFGLFFHWGVYSVPACENEWYSRNIYLKGSRQNLEHERRYGSISRFGYKDLIPAFKAECFDPDAWADLVVKSGAKYAGPVAEHADNYSMWNSRINPVNSVRTGPRRDIVGECEEAFRRRGIRYLTTFHHQWLWGWFMSTDPDADVYDPANEVYYGPALPLETNRYQPYRLPDAAFYRIWLEKVKEVVRQYRPDVLYFDGRLMILPEEVLYQAVSAYYEAVPEGIITYKQRDLPEGIGLRDVECGRFTGVQEFFWQTDDRLEDKVTWCIVQEPRYKPAGRIIQQLADVTAKNGALLLNVGPRADGTFHPEAVRQLTRVGDWLAVNGEAIYGTEPFSVAGEGVTVSDEEDYNAERLRQQMKDGLALESGQYRLTGNDVRYTQTDSAIYVIGFGMPEDRTLRLAALRSDAAGALRSAVMLGSGAEIEMQRDSGALMLRLPEQLPFEEAYVIRLEKA